MLKLPHLSLALAASLFSVALSAQQGKAPPDGVTSVAANGQRSEANLIVLEFQGGKVANLLGLACLTYGTAEWKPEYAAKVDELTKGKIFRLGRDNWAILDHTAAIDFGGKTVPAGTWYVAVARDAAGKWSLVFCDPAKVKAAGVWPPDATNAPRAHEIPLQHEKLASESAPKLQVAWDKDQTNPAKGTLTITWGNQKISTPYEFKVAAKSTKGEAKDSTDKKGK